jgi:molybdopterin molybdotransferase
MMPPGEAFTLLKKMLKPLGTEEVPLDQAGGRVLAGDITARWDLPPFANSAMDGYALRAEDTAAARPDTPLRLSLASRPLAAGDGSLSPLAPGQTARIFTGAPVPSGADAVVMQEAVSPAPEGDAVVLTRPAKPGDHIRPAGEDVKAGDPLLPAGRRLRPYEIGLLAAQGIRQVTVNRRPRIALLITGDELTSGDAPPAFGRIYDSNGPALKAALERWGVTVEAPRRVKDDLTALQTALGDALNRADMALISGGVSVGDRDYTVRAVKGIGATVIFWRLAIKPGKPHLFAVKPGPQGDKFIFGLPGNPLSALVCLEEFVRPALEGLEGRRMSLPSYHLRGRAENDYPRSPDRTHYLFCQARSNGEGFLLHILRPQGSARLAMACRADALARVPPGPDRIRPNDLLDFRWLK